MSVTALNKTYTNNLSSFRPVSNHQPVIVFDKNLFLELSPQGKIDSVKHIDRACAMYFHSLCIFSKPFNYNI